MPGKRPMPFWKYTTYPGHSGVDWPQSRGVAIRASGPGKVVRIRENSLGGWWTIVLYDDGALIGYCHQDNRPTVVSVGQRVVEGTIIGYVGSKGRSTGPHLHGTNMNNETYSATIALFDTSRVVGGTPTGGGGAVGNWPANKLYGEAWVRAAQHKLALMGLYSGDVDGKDGPKTQDGTKVLQRAGGLDDDGVFGPATNKLADLILAGHNATKRPTSDIQRVLGVVVDNNWGGKTSFGCYVWQKKNGLTADAIWGPASDAKAFGTPTTPPTVPTKPQLPARVARPAEYPFAVRSWMAPYAYNVETGKENVRAGGKITGVALHHTGSTADQESYFTSQNDRISCPNVYINERAEVIELIPLRLKPSSTGAANDYTVAIEVENQSGDPTWGISDSQHEAIAQYIAWLSRQTNVGVPVSLPLTREAIKGHREFSTTNTGTICPGPSMNLDRIVQRAKEILNPPVPQPDPNLVLIPRADLEALEKTIDEWLDKN